MQMLRGKRILTAILSMVGAAICCAGLAPSTLAQSSSSAVNGVVTDTSKAVVIGAKVVLRNADTNIERVTVSNGTGDYFFSSVPPCQVHPYVRGAELPHGGDLRV